MKKISLIFSAVMIFVLSSCTVVPPQDNHKHEYVKGECECGELEKYNSGKIVEENGFKFKDGVLLEYVGSPKIDLTLTKGDFEYLDVISEDDNFKNVPYMLQDIDHDIKLNPFIIPEYYMEGDKKIYVREVAENAIQLDEAFNGLLIYNEHIKLNENSFSGTKLDVLAIISSDYIAEDSINIPEINVVYTNIKHIGTEAFCNTSIKYLSFGPNTEIIGEGAFAGCNTELIFLSKNIKTIGEYAFAGNSHWSNFSLPNSVTTIGQGAFEGFYCDGTFILGNGIDKISKEMFSGAEFSELRMPNTIKTIEEEAFKYATGLIIISNSVELIKTYAFDYFSGLVLIPSTVKTIETYAFHSAEEIYVMAESKPTGWDDEWAEGAKKIIWNF